MAKRKPKREYSLTRHHTALGAYLQQCREAALLTQRVVSIKLGYSSAQFISNFERGISAPPNRRLRELIKMYRAETNKVIGLVLEGEREKMAAVLRG